MLEMYILKWIHLKSENLSLLNLSQIYLLKKASPNGTPFLPRKKSCDNPTNAYTLFGKIELLSLFLNAFVMLSNNKCTNHILWHHI